MSERPIFTKTKLGDAAVIALDGPLNLEKGAVLREVFWNCIQTEGWSELIVDLAMVPELDPSTISLLVSTKNVVTKKRGRLILVGVNQKSMDLLEQTHLTDYFDIRATLAEAVSGQDPNPINGENNVLS